MAPPKAAGRQARNPQQPVDRVPLQPALKAALREMCKDGAAPELLQATLEHGEISMGRRDVLADADPETTMPLLQSVLDGAPGCYVLARVDAESNSPVWTVVLWLPPDTPTLERAMLLSGHRALVQALPLDATRIHEVTLTQKTEVSRQSVMPLHTAKATSKPMCPAERLAWQEQVEAAASLVDTRHPDAVVQRLITFEDDTSRGRVKKFADGGCNCLTLSISDGNGTLQVKECPHDNPAALAKSIPQREPRVYLLRMDAKIALFTVPDKEDQQRCSLYALCKVAVLRLLKEMRVVPDKTVEFRGGVTHEVIDKIFEEEAPRGEFYSIVRPAPPSPESRVLQAFVAKDFK
eukprot:GHVU01105440.1.p1 GENE.GHVU01105440.1~~GHVU01105440.1.p1  ORF type:complete len:350 (-),score=72.13 GHVU01105440.1:434-1483(-)